MKFLTPKTARLLLMAAVCVALVMMTANHVMLEQIHQEAMRQATRQQEGSMKAFWELVGRRGRNFHVEDGRLRVGDWYVLNDNNEIPDKIYSITGSRATVFMGDTRIATNIITPDGRRAIGTRLSGPARDAVFKEGIRYRGEADILGVPYFTAYDPIRDFQGRIIGALFVGVKQSEYLARYDLINMRIRVINGILAGVFVLLAILLILDRRRSEQAIKKQLDFQQLLLDTIPSPIFSKDARGRYNLCNKAMDSYLGVPAEELIGKTVFELWPETLARSYWEMDQEIMGTTGTQVYESRVKYADGSLHDVIFHKAALRDKEGRPAGLVGVILDITERKRAEIEAGKLEAQMHHSRMVESLMVQLNHDLNTPLTPLFALLPMIRRQVSDPGLQRMLDICQQCSNQIKGLAGKSLDLVRLSSARPVLNPVRLVAAADFALTELAEALGQRGVTCRNEIDRELHVQGSAEQLALLFKNLLGNAARYAARNGSIRLKSAMENDTVEVRVQDDGIGLDPEHLSLVFNEFFKADPSRQDLNTQGLGLAICKRIVANHGGRIWAQSPGKGKGTTIFFTLTPADSARQQDPEPAMNYEI